jgi:hypothetical protein
MRRPAIARLAAAVLLTAAAGVALPAGPAAAAACSSGDGVTVVVDFNELGGGLQQVCDPSGGGDTAAALFTGNGFPLTYAQRQPGYVCRVSGVPESDPCVNTSPADAYWGLWWSDGESGSWTYSSLGAGSLRIPDGGYVAFAWDQSDGSVAPGSTPTAHPSAPSPTPTPSPSPSSSSAPASPAGGGTGGGSGNGTAGGGGSDPSAPATSSGASPTASPSATPSAPASATPTKKPSRTPSADESATATTGSSAPSAEVGAAVAPTASDPDAGGDGLPVWVAPALIGLVFAAAGAAYWLRRRVSPGP